VVVGGYALEKYEQILERSERNLRGGKGINNTNSEVPVVSPVRRAKGNRVSNRR